MMAALPPRRRVPARTIGAGGPGVRELGAQATREAILHAAIEVFARDGYDGGRIEKISKAANSYDRMIYYYFGSKEGLFVEVLEEIYRRFNEAEAKLQATLDFDEPVRALEAVVRFVCRYYREHSEFGTLLSAENLYEGRHIAKSPRVHEFSSPVMGLVGRILDRGVAAGCFRAGLSPRDVYVMIASMGYFRLSNRYTLAAFLGEGLPSAEALQEWEGFVVGVVLRAVTDAETAVRPTPRVPEVQGPRESA